MKNQALAGEIAPPSEVMGDYPGYLADCLEPLLLICTREELVAMIERDAETAEQLNTALGEILRRRRILKA